MVHPYVDNACAHNDHDACPGWCPYCEAPCVCGCGHDGRDAGRLPGGDAPARPGPAPTMPTRANPRTEPVPTGSRRR